MQPWASALRDVTAAIREMLTAIAIILVAVWIVRGVDLARVTKAEVPNIIKIELKEIAQASQASANQLEAANNEVAGLRERIDKLATAVGAYGDPRATELKNAVAATQKAAVDAESRIAESAQDTARALARIDEAKAQINPNAVSPPATGWYYLGKVSKDGMHWLPSSARDNLRFVPPLVEGENLVSQLSAPGIRQVYSTGYKYVRSRDTVPGNRVAGEIVRTLRPNVRVRLGDIDTVGKDDGDTVVWALVQVPE